MIKLTCDQTGEDLTNKPHITITRGSLRKQNGDGQWKPYAHYADNGILTFKDWDAVCKWGKEQEKKIDEDEWNMPPVRNVKLSY